MGWLGNILRSIVDLFGRSSRQENVVAEYVIREHHAGRSLDEILKDAYVTNRLSPEQVARLLDRSDILKAVGEDMVAAHRASAT
ncbi:MAG TPA: hypothetical protein VG265_03075 [Gaiellaceae bacterium]|nr:hypothetical protein [Gaiellaceae bacterium]